MMQHFDEARAVDAAHFAARASNAIDCRRLISHQLRSFRLHAEDTTDFIR
jgi:hypothetical protein